MSTVIIISPKPPPTGDSIAQIAAFNAAKPKVFVLSFNKSTRKILRDKAIAAFSKV